jgi:hypothetical protein
MKSNVFFSNLGSLNCPETHDDDEKRYEIEETNCNNKSTGNFVY